MDILGRSYVYPKPELITWPIQRKVAGKNRPATAVVEFDRPQHDRDVEGGVPFFFRYHEVPDDPFAPRLTIECSQWGWKGAVSVDQVCLWSGPGRREPTSTDLAAIRLDEAVEQAVQRVRAHLARLEGARDAEPQTDVTGAAAGSTTAALRTKRRLSPGFIKEVAEEYNAAARRGEYPTKAVRTRWSAAPATASKWVKLAREQGLIED